MQKGGKEKENFQRKSQVVSEHGLSGCRSTTWFTRGRDSKFSSACKEENSLFQKRWQHLLLLTAVSLQLMALAIIWELGNSFDVIFGPIPNQF